MTSVELLRKLRKKKSSCGNRPLSGATQRWGIWKRPGKIPSAGRFALGCALALAAMQAATQAATITVTGTGDTIAVDNLVTLREAITSANNDADVNADVVAVGAYGTDTINFNVAGAGVRTIAPTSTLPAITDTVIIDGYSQPGASANTLAVGNNAKLRIEIASGVVDGLTLGASGSTVRGLLINVTSGFGIRDQSAGGNMIEGNWIGIDAAGTTLIVVNGIFIDSSNNTIGGSAPADRNVITGSPGNGAIVGFSGSGNVIQGNHIGTNATGGAGLGFGGIILRNNSVLGGTAGGAGNVISGSRDVLMSFTTGSVVQGNFFGLSADGTTPLTNTGGVISINQTQNNTIGGASAAARNVSLYGIMISGVSGSGGGNTVQGNFIGTNPAGTAALGTRVSTPGISLNSATNALILDNVISNRDVGISLFGANNTIQGNFIGTNAAGTAAIPNFTGISAGGGDGVTGNIIGGDTAAERNVISGNVDEGLSLGAGLLGMQTVQGNFIGTAADGLTSLGNGGTGILIAASSGQIIGGVLPGEGNLIAFNSGDGVGVTSGAGHAIRGNSIHSNGGLGIDLGDDGVTANDLGDADTGANNLQNYPVLTSVSSSGGDVTIIGTLNSEASTTYRLEFFGSDKADPSHFGEGQVFLGATNVSTDASGDASFDVTFPNTSGPRVTATATDANGNTSEFSLAPTPKLLNISTRMQVLTDDNVLIGGFIVTGISPKKVIVRAIGPSLTAFGVPGALADPTLDLNAPDGSVTSNDDWKETQQAEIEATGLQPTNDAESAILQTLAPGAYTAIVRGANGTTGVGLVEAYDLDQPADSKLANISTRGFIDTGDNVMIGGFIIGPADLGEATVLVRAIGPSLANFGVANALQDPVLELHDSNGGTITNDNWRDDQETEITATGLMPTDEAESAILQTLAPGNYTAIVRGVADTTGVGLVEVYDLE